MRARLGALATVALLLTTVRAAPGQPLPSLKILIPAQPRRGLGPDLPRHEQVLRQEKLVTGAVRLSNRGGAGGTIGLAEFARSRGEAGSLMTMGLVMVGAILTNKSPVTLDAVTPIARLTNEYLVIAVPAASRMQTLKDFLEALRKDPGAVSIAGGSRGGSDHMLAALIAESLGVPGTMPHALIICFGSTVDALNAYDDVLEPKLNRVALIDTFLDEKLECLNVAEALGKRFFAVRFDTPGSRRGNFYRILEECRWESDIRGYKHIKFYAIGGIKEEDIPVLNPVVDGYEIGTSISNAPVVDYAMDIMEVEGKPRPKRGKWSGSKRVLACQKCGERRIVPHGKKQYLSSCGKKFEDFLIPVLDYGRSLTKLEPASAIRKRVLNNVKSLALE